MDYLKFAGWCLLAVIVFMVCGIIFSYDNRYLGLTLSLVITGAGFVRVKPAHFKIGYAIWISIFLSSLFYLRWIEEMHLRPELAYIDYYAAWLAGCITANPVCYWLGKRLHFRMTRNRALLSVAERFD